MVDSGLSSNLENAKAAILVHRPVHFATLVTEPVRPVQLVSDLTGLPNRRAFDDGKTFLFVAIADVSDMRAFNDMYGRIPGDKLLHRLADILVSVGLDAYHDHGNRFLCKAESRSELSTRLSEARRMLREPFQLYADGRIQSIEGADFSFGIGETLQEASAALYEAQKLQRGPTEWLRKILGCGGYG
jgi:GGDEF domain-containing protein